MKRKNNDENNNGPQTKKPKAQKKLKEISSPKLKISDFQNRTYIEKHIDRLLYDAFSHFKPDIEDLDDAYITNLTKRAIKGDKTYLFFNVVISPDNYLSYGYGSQNEAIAAIKNRLKSIYQFTFTRRNWIIIDDQCSNTTKTLSGKKRFISNPEKLTPDDLVLLGTTVFSLFKSIEWVNDNTDNMLQNSSLIKRYPVSRTPSVRDTTNPKPKENPNYFFKTSNNIPQLKHHINKLIKYIKLHKIENHIPSLDINTLDLKALQEFHDRLSAIINYHNENLEKKPGPPAGLTNS